MESIKKQSIKAYILLESLIALAVLSVISTLVLQAIVSAQKTTAFNDKKIEELSLAKAAFDSNQNSLELNGAQVSLDSTERHLAVYAQEKEILSLEILQVEK